MADPALRISGLGKAYRIRRDDTPMATNLGEALTRRLRAPLKRPRTETFWALKDIDLEVERGEVVGVIGRNGAGKSTLLKVLSRITEPTEGRVELYGRVGSLLEVGTGFHPELTGRENIFLNGAILGMRRGEIRARFDEIVAFAGVEKFLDTPVKRYSSGMYVRLAFAVAAHLEPEILIVDEVLAVGDAEFQKRCLGKMQDVAQSGRTVLFVSHNMAAIGKLCSMAMHINEGRLASVGDCASILRDYSQAAVLLAAGDAEFESDTCHLRVIDTKMSPAEDGLAIEVVIDVTAKKRIANLGVGVQLNDSNGERLSYLMPELLGSSFGPLDRETKRYRIRVPHLEQRLASGDYVLGASLHEYQYSTLLRAEWAVPFSIPETDVYGTGFAPRRTWSGLIPLPAKVESCS